MTARKPKPRKAAPRKGSKPTLEQRVATIEAARPYDDVLREVLSRLDALETRKQFRDASHDEPVSNAGEAIGVPLTPAQLARLMAYSGKRWWQFWRRL